MAELTREPRDTLMEELRGSLNEYYSAKTNAQGTYLLTAALIATAMIALDILNATVRAIGLAILTGAAFRMMWRIVYWGKFSYWVLRVPPAKEAVKESMIFGLHEGTANTVRELRVSRWRPVMWVIVVTLAILVFVGFNYSFLLTSK